MLRTHVPLFWVLALCLGGLVDLWAADDRPVFTRLRPLPAPQVVKSSSEYPGDNYRAWHLVDGKVSTEYSSNGDGTNTFVDFVFEKPVRLAGFRHQDRRDPATVGASELAISNAQGVVKVPITHVNRRAGVTFVALPEPVLARHVRWRVTELGPDRYGTVGGAEIAFFTSGEPEAAPSGIGLEVQAPSILKKKGDGLVRPIQVSLDYPYGTPVRAVVRVEGLDPLPVELKAGVQALDFDFPAHETERRLKVAVEYAGQPVASHQTLLKPARKLTVYVLPHSHTDIGYTEIQTAIEDKQVKNLVDGIQYARQTAGYPEGARFIWNVEVTWAADLYLRRLSQEQRDQFFEAVKSGQVALNGMYLNELTGLCRPEELVRLFRYSTQLAEHCGVTIDSAMISDVPGYTWGTVTAMAQAGLKYFSVAPNYFDRIGTILREWENKPFYWVGPDGQSQVLVWIPYRGYALSHIIHQLSAPFAGDYVTHLDQSGYPYDIIYMRWAGHGDNAVPDPAICEFVKEWSAQYAWPKFVISSTSQAFQAFENRYGQSLARVSGDWTPYWEDGAGSSALETALNRQSSDRLVQAEALWAMGPRAGYPAAAFAEAWNQVLLYSEHTWGAWCSVSEPERKETLEQWAIKQSYALAADRQSRRLLDQVLRARPGETSASAIDLYNTTSWPRTELVTLPKELGVTGDRVADDEGRPVPAQRLSSGELAFLARDVPPLAARRYTVRPGTTLSESQSMAQAPVLDNGLIRLRVDEKTGGIVELRLKGLETNFADARSGQGLNEYLYLVGDNPAEAQGNGPVKISVKESGPLVASLLIESDAPGCHHLSREARLVAGLDHVELLNRVDKRKLAAKNYHAKDGKESLNFAFPFHVPGGTMRLDLPLGLIRPELDQMPSACKNWLTVGRWADVSNQDYGICWVTLDAPLVQVGGLTAILLGSQTNPDVWLTRLEPSTKLYSWAMNNHWGTNYRAYQEGPVWFRFMLRPHRRPSPVEASRFATGFSQPLLPVVARGAAPSKRPRLKVDSPDVLVTAFKPTDDGQGWMVRLFGASGREARVHLDWSEPVPRRLWLSDTGEKRIKAVEGAVSVPAWGLVSLRAE